MSLVINGALLGLFAVQHTVMARPSFKRRSTQAIPKEMKRSTLVPAATAALALLLWQWRPLPDLVWSIDDPVMAGLVLAISGPGWALLLISTFLISHFQLFCLSLGWARILGIKEGDGPFLTPLFYTWIRHPLYLGFILAFWAPLHVSAGHLSSMVMTTGYILVGIRLEAWGLLAHFGERWLSYRRQVATLLVKFATLRDGETTPTKVALPTLTSLRGRSVLHIHG